MEWNYLSIPKRQRCYRWSFGMDKSSHRTVYYICDYLSMLMISAAITHISTRLPQSHSLLAWRLSVGFEIWPPFGWRWPFVIGWSWYRLGLPCVTLHGLCTVQFLVECQNVSPNYSTIYHSAITYHLIHCLGLGHEAMTCAVCLYVLMDSLAQDCSNSSVLATELLQSCHVYSLPRMFQFRSLTFYF